jgi:hypothetical protein
MRTQKIKSPKYGQTPYYNVNGWLRIESVECVSLKNAIFEYDPELNTCTIRDQNGDRVGELYNNNKHLCIALTSKKDGGE